MARRRKTLAGQVPTVVRVVETVGLSERGWDDAVADAVRGARDEAPEPIAVEVTRLWADLDRRKRLARYRAAVKVAYRQRVTPPPRDTAARAAPKKRTRQT